jgi:hypothetical protein
MGKKEQLLAKAKSRPKNISFQELEALAAAYGLPLEPGGSHYVQKLPEIKGGKNESKGAKGDRLLYESTLFNSTP